MIIKDMKTEIELKFDISSNVDNIVEVVSTICEIIGNELKENCIYGKTNITPTVTVKTLNEEVLKDEV